MPIYCASKVYGDDVEGTFSLNDCYEFVGIVSLDPSLAAFPTDGTENDVVEQFGQQERLAKSPPPSLVPRHVACQLQLFGRVTVAAANFFNPFLQTFPFFALGSTP